MIRQLGDGLGSEEREIEIEIEAVEKDDVDRVMDSADRILDFIQQLNESDETELDEGTLENEVEIEMDGGEVEVEIEATVDQAVETAGRILDIIQSARRIHRGR